MLWNYNEYIEDEEKQEWLPHELSLGQTTIGVLNFRNKKHH